ncbi:stage II sporulation protein M [Candidatus Pyrohabitans sp.]
MRKSLAALIGTAVFTGYLLSGYTHLFLSLPAGSIFLKNAAAALVTIYLGLLLSHVELQIYRRTSEETYSMLDRLSEPLYVVLSRFRSFRTGSPLRSCLFYLYFVPLLSLFANLTVLSAFFWSFASRGRVAELYAYLMPHALLEIPAMLGSIALGIKIANRLGGVATRGGVEAFEREMRKIPLESGFALPALGIVVLLYLAALLEG